MNDDSIEMNKNLGMHFRLAKSTKGCSVGDNYVDPQILSKNTLLNEIKLSHERYKHGPEIARGGVKIISEAQDTFTNRKVAIATLKSIENHTAIENFLREARLTASLQHPNIIPVYNIGINDEDSPFFSMKLIEGESLHAILKKLRLTKASYIRKYSLRQRLDIFLKVCDAMSYAHSKNIIHLDLKPENIQISNFGDVIICDWGLAHSLDHSASQSPHSLEQLSNKGVEQEGRISGTPGFMAPEQALGESHKISKLTDIYSLGAILYALITLQPPCHGDTLEKTMDNTILGKIQAPSLVADIPETLELICLKCLGFNKQQRYASVDELSKDMHSWLNGYATSLKKPSLFLQLKLFYARETKLVWASFATITIFLTTVSGFLWAQYDAAQQQQKAHEYTQGLLHNLKKSQTIQLKQSQKMAQQVYLQALDYYKTREFKKAHLLAAHASTLDPFLKKAYDMEINCLLLDKSFKRALALINKHNSAPKLKKIVKDCIENPPSVSLENSVALWAYFFNSWEPHACRVIYRWLQHFPVDQRIKLAATFLSEVNKTQISISYTMENNKLCIILTRQNKLKNLSPLLLFPEMYSLDLSNCKDLFSLNHLKKLNLKKLNLSHCRSLSNFKALKGMKLIYLNLEGTYMNKLTLLKNMPLIELVLGRERLSLDSLNFCPKLKKITVRAGGYPKDLFRLLRKNISIYERVTDGSPRKIR